MDDGHAVLQWMAKARMACAWISVDPPPLAELLILAARYAGLTFH